MWLQLDTVWVSCEGENPADKEFIGAVEYIPFQGFPGYFYPFLGVENYVSPLVAVHFKNITSEYYLAYETMEYINKIVCFCFVYLFIFRHRKLL